jgi:predicted DsbA family dithiol-disulfide isomerase
MLLQRHFDESRNITLHPFLAKLACVPIPCSDGVTRSLFPDEPTALEWLNSGALRYEVISSAKAAREHGIKGIPMLVLNGKYAICGARDESIYYQVRNRDGASAALC